MKERFCEFYGKFFPSISDAEELYTSYLANCVFNHFLSFTAIVLNVVTIYVIRKTSSLPKTLKILLTSLAVSDVGVGLLVQPFYTSLLVRLLRQINLTCIEHKIYFLSANVFCTLSLLNVLAVSVDRFLAVHFHLRYQELVTHRRIILVVISIWFFSLVRSFATLWLSNYVNFSISILLNAGGVILTSTIYWRLYLTVRRHKNQIHGIQQSEQTEEMFHISNILKTAVSVFYVCLVFLLCYLPIGICQSAVTLYGSNHTLIKFYHYSMTLVFLNSSLNPVIYCWKMRDIRHTVLNILRRASLNKNRTSR